jgi:integrase
MAHIRTYETTERRKGKPVRVYRVVWREPVRDKFGLPTTKTRARQESYPIREAAEARRDELNAARHTTGTSALAEQRKAGEQPFGYYARAWLDAQRVKVASGRVKPATVDGYAARLWVYVLPEFGGRAIAAITPRDCEQFLATLVGRGLTPATLRHHWSVLRNVFVYAVRHKAITANPVDGVDFSANSAQRRNRRHYPLSAEQVAAVANSIGERYPVYELMTYFAAYTGLRAEELAGLEVGDLVFAPGPSCTVHVRRAKKRPAREWTADTLKSARSRRDVPLPPWLATKLVDYLANTHPRSAEPHASLWPNRALGGARRRGCRAVAPLDFTEPCDMGAYYKNLMKPALEAVGLPASRPATDDTPAVEGVRLHDLRHTFAVLQLSAGVHFMQVSQWRGHATYSLTLDVYGGYIPQADGGVPNALPEPQLAPAKPAETASNVVPLFG